MSHVRSIRTLAFDNSHSALRSYRRLQKRGEGVRLLLHRALHHALLALFDKRSVNGTCGHTVSYTTLPMKDTPVNIFAPESAAEYPGQILRVHRITGYYTEPSNIRTFMCVCHDHRLCVPQTALDEVHRRFIHVNISTLSHHDLHALLPVTLGLLRA